MFVNKRASKPAYTYVGLTEKNTTTYSVNMNSASKLACF